jgi:hypothetical protein
MIKRRRQRSGRIDPRTIKSVDFGEVPAIEPPPADEVFDATHLIESNVQKAAEGG